MMMTYLFYKTDYLYRSFFHKTFFYFTEKHYLCALKMTITLSVSYTHLTLPTIAVV